VFSGCRAARLKDLPGEYVAKTDWGTSTLILRTDHTMKQEVRTNRGEVRQNSGVWTFDDEFLTTKPCLVVGHRTEGLWSGACGNDVTVIGFRKVEISLDPDFGLAYEKTKGQTEK
jgi:hypothetical protein